MIAAKNWFIIGIAALMPYLIAVESQGATGVPDTINLDALAQLYQGVKFDHAGHIRTIQDCADCHHHATGTLFEDRNCVRCHRNSSQAKNVACRACHLATPFSAAALKDRDPQTYHADKPGLKGAYHLNCVGCHEKRGGPTGCEDCHPRTKEGDMLYRAGAYKPAKGAGKPAHH